MIDSPNSEEDDKCVPRAAVYKMIKDCTQQIRVSSEAKEFFVQCCNEFIHTLALQANSVCEQQTKKLVHPDHIVLALENLGFGAYKTDCLNAMETAQKELQQKRRKLHGKMTSIYTDEELRQQQELLFQQVSRGFFCFRAMKREECLLFARRLGKKHSNWKRTIGLGHRNCPRKF